MSSDKNVNAPTSGTTSTSVPPTANPSELTEDQFLQQQQELARAAIARTWEQIQAGLKEGINPVEWTREYPWPALGAAAVAGFVAASAMIPSKQEQALKKLAALERALHPTAPAPVAVASDKPHKQTILGSLIADALKTLQPVLISAITAKVAKPDSENGHEKPDSAGRSHGPAAETAPRHGINPTDSPA